MGCLVNPSARRNVGQACRVAKSFRGKKCGFSGCARRFAVARTAKTPVRAGSRAEPGALGYEWFVSEDGGVVHLVERYAGSDAALAHLETFGERFAGRFLDATDPVRLTVMGSPSDTVKTTLSGFAPKFLQPFGGFVRDHGT